MTTPNVARMYDYLLGGKENFAADRAAADKVLALVPEARPGARGNRAFLGRAVRFLAADGGVRQFLDIGTGLPTQGNVHEAAASVAPDTKVIYADYDPVVVAHGRALLADRSDRAWMIEADIRSPEQILGHPTVSTVIDFGEPVALVLTATLHFLTDADDPYAAVSQLTRPLAPGSYLVVSHVTSDHHPAEAPVVRDVYDQATAPFTFRSHAQVLRFFDGFDLVEPGSVPCPLWRPATTDGHAGVKSTDFAGVGRKRPSGYPARTEDTRR